MIPEAIAAEAEVPGKYSVQPLAFLVVIYRLNQVTSKSFKFLIS